MATNKPPMTDPNGQTRNSLALTLSDEEMTVAVASSVALTSVPECGGNRENAQATSVATTNMSPANAVVATAPDVVVVPAKIPYNNVLYQVNLPFFQATLSPPMVIAWMLFCAVVGVVLGAIVVTESDNIFEKRVQYSHVNRYQYPRDNAQENASRANGGFGFEAEGLTFYQGARAVVEFDIDRPIEPPIYLSYTITNMYQNYRPYTRSISYPQLQGDMLSTDQVVDCRPLRAPSELHSTLDSRASLRVGDTTLLYGDMIYFPCGVQPWTLFNDSISLFRVDDPLNTSTFGTLICNASDFSTRGDRLTLTAAQNPCTKKGIAWKSDRVRRYKPTPAHFERVDHWTYFGAVNTSEEYLRKGWYYKEAGHRVPDVLDEDLMVWLRIAALPDFRKLHRVVHTRIAPGTYRLVVNEFFDTESFSGSKGILLRSDSWLGARNYELGILLLGGGTVCLILAIVFFVRHHYRRLHPKPDLLPEQRPLDIGGTASPSRTPRAAASPGW